ncbi:lysine-specific demethylase 7A isoform X2 [Balaenoptera acutorostrata]|uniref:Lysine-specific demethylase 7A isoform X2 n=1 Tax=Balaenoptera acutorostrata TaxID=9767 RepID=A0ABM3TVP1_BALAC|nr:lysine-specific demethylase 7A isoform X2 [Balaenoptera acutorostrata]
MAGAAAAVAAGAAAGAAAAAVSVAAPGRASAPPPPPPVYCVCRQPYDVNRFMIECDICKDWFHGSCVGVEEHHAVDIDLYHCPNCAVLHGSSLMKKRRNWHRHDYTEIDDGSKPVQAGTRTFVKELRSRVFPSADEIIVKMHGSQLTQRYLEKHGFEVPIMVPKLDDLGLRLPPPTFSVMDVERYVGWIHAVLTSQDCMAFGGNFLHNLNIGMQLRCYEMEKRLKTPDLFKFPFFEAICWFVAKNLLETLKELREDGFQPQTYLVQGVKALHTALKLWMKKELVSEHAFEIPDNVRPGHLIKELSKVIRAIEEENGKPVKSQGIPTVCPVSRSSNEAASPHHSRRRMRKLRDHNVRTPSNLDILELHTREVLRRLEMCPWEEDILSSKLNGKFNKHLQPSSTVPEWRAKDNDLRLLLTNGRIIKDERQPFADQSLYTADSENEEDKRRTKKAKVKMEESSGIEGVENEVSQKPLNRFLTSVKSELRNRSSEYSDISDSEDSGPDCTALKNNFTTEESESSGDEKKQEITSNFKEESNVMRSFLQKSQKPSRSEIPVKRECPTSTSTEEEAIQGMLSMAGLHYSTCLQRQIQSTDCGGERHSLQDPSSCHSSNHEVRQLYRCDKPVESGYHVKTEDQDLRSSSWIKQFDTTSRFNRQDLSRGQKCIRKEVSSEISQKVQSRNSVDSSGSSPQSGKYMQSSSLMSGACQISNGSISPERPVGETSFSVPLHPTKRPASNPPPISNQATKGKRPKKGMATAKQRLGKILKLNRNGHARFFV